MSNLNTRTRKYYDSLLSELTQEYVEYRWRNHPVQRLHYLQTQRTLRRALNRYVTPTGRILEVGCGPGTWSDDFLLHADELTLLDISREMVSEASARYRDDRRVSVVCGDFTSGPFGERTLFDAIVSIRAIEYMAPKARIAREVSRLLNPGGTLIVVTKNPAWRDAKEEAGFDEKSSDGIHRDWISRTALTRLLAEQGLDVVAVHPASMGSYEPPLANPVGRLACHVLHRLTMSSEMSPKWDSLTESYLLVARQPAHDRVR